MTGFIDRLAAHAKGQFPIVRPRLRSRFEPAGEPPPAAFGAVDTALDQAGPAPAGDPAPNPETLGLDAPGSNTAGSNTAGSDTPGLDAPRVDAKGPDSPGPGIPDLGYPDFGPADLGSPGPGRPAPGQPNPIPAEAMMAPGVRRPRPAPAARQSPGRIPAADHGGRPAPLTVRETDTRHEPPALAQDPSAEVVARPPAEQPSSPAQESGASAVRMPPASNPLRHGATPDEPGAARSHPSTSEPTHPRSVAAPNQSPRTSGRRAPAGRQPAAPDDNPPIPSTKELIHDHVVPALREAGLLSPGARTEVADDPIQVRATSAGRAGVDLVTLPEEPVLTRSDPVPGGPAQVTVTIGQVSVVRAAPRPGARTDPPARPTGPDHSAYLARRREDTR
jgi:hypothetical protein